LFDSFFVCFGGRLVGCLVWWLIDWSVGSLVGFMAAQLVD
jgi:hypothetical protein